jgi:hypothetical protein
MLAGEFSAMLNRISHKWPNWSREKAVKQPYYSRMQRLESSGLIDEVLRKQDSGRKWGLCCRCSSPACPNDSADVRVTWDLMLVNSPFSNSYTPEHSTCYFIFILPANQSHLNKENLLCCCPHVIQKHAHQLKLALVTKWNLHESCNKNLRTLWNRRWKLDIYQPQSRMLFLDIA